MPKLSATALGSAVEIFGEMRGQKLLPLNEIDTDTVRHKLDEAFARRVLRLDESALVPGGPLALLRMTLALEPSIHRGKKSRVGVVAGNADKGNE